MACISWLNQPLVTFSWFGRQTYFCQRCGYIADNNKNKTTAKKKCTGVIMKAGKIYRTLSIVWPSDHTNLHIVKEWCINYFDQRGKKSDRKSVGNDSVLLSVFWVKIYATDKPQRWAEWIREILLLNFRRGFSKDLWWRVGKGGSFLGFMAFHSPVLRNVLRYCAV